MKIAVLDDDAMFFNFIRHAFRNHIYEIDFSFFQDSKSFLYSLDHNKYEVVFLDVEMPDISGINLSKEIHSLYRDCFIVFITNHPETVFNAFGVNVLAFVEKQHLEKEADSVWEKIINEKKHNKNVILQLKNNRILTIAINQITYLEISMRKVYLFTIHKQKYVLKYVKLRDVFDLIAHPSFIYINRSCIVNLNHVRLLDSDHLFLFGYESPLYISRNQVQAVKKSYMSIHL